ncbi:MAG: metallopeptidase family protein [Pseudomonadota bacterium]
MTDPEEGIPAAAVPSAEPVAEAGAGTLTAPDAATIAALAEVARDALPDPIRAAAGDVALRVAEFAPEEVIRSLGAADAFEITGLYDGTPLTQRGASLESGELPPTVWLYRRAILDEWAARPGVTLGALVGHILVHEIAHHFGWSDAEIAEIDRWWDWQEEEDAP